MTPRDVVERRGITEVVHFTTGEGLLGILATKAALSRNRLPEQKLLEYILKMNSTIVRDPEWKDFVNLSISEINSSFLEISKRWHPEVEWMICAFDPIILDHDGVRFTTTNNIYPAVRRGKGEAGLQAAFGESVIGRMSELRLRRNDMPLNVTTDIEAEVLYPESLSTEYLRTIYVGTPVAQDHARAAASLVGHRQVEVIVAPERFQPSAWR